MTTTRCGDCVAVYGECKARLQAYKELIQQQGMKSKVKQNILKRLNTKIDDCQYAVNKVRTPDNIISAIDILQQDLDVIHESVMYIHDNCPDLIMMSELNHEYTILLKVLNILRD